MIALRLPTEGTPGDPDYRLKPIERSTGWVGVSTVDPAEEAGEEVDRGGLRKLCQGGELSDEFCGSGAVFFRLQEVSADIFSGGAKAAKIAS